jgi:GxxExxY protein
MNARKRISEEVIGCAITVSNILGAGFLESVYENALAIEFANAGLVFERQKALPVIYKEKAVGNYYADFLVADRLIVELKALSQLRTEHEAQLLNYMKACSISAGLLLNFGTPRLGVKRKVINYDEDEQI